MTAALKELERPTGDLAVQLRRARDFETAIVAPTGVALPLRLEMASKPVGTQYAWSSGSPYTPEWAAGKAYARDGQLELEGVHAGRSLLRLWSPGCALYEREIDVPASGPRRHR